MTWHGAGAAKRDRVRAPAIFLAAFAILLTGALPAAAHKLKVFATVEGTSISGFAFFVGGGRPHGAHVMFRDAEGRDLAIAVTDAEGTFSFAPAKAEDVTIVVDAGDGHSAETRITSDRLAPLALPASSEAAPAPAAMQGNPSGAAVPAQPAAAAQAGCDPVFLARLVDEAVARRIRPLLEAGAEAEDKVRFKDIVGGIGMIVGLFGAAMWASARAKTRASRTDA